MREVGHGVGLVLGVGALPVGGRIRLVKGIIMAKKVWAFKLEDGNHVVELEHGYFSGKRDITIDGIPLESSSKLMDILWDTGSVHNFDVSGVPCVLQIKGKVITFNYNLYVNRKLINPSS